MPFRPPAAYWPAHLQGAPLRPRDIMALSSEGNGLAAVKYGGPNSLGPTIRAACTLAAAQHGTPTAKGFCTQHDATPDRQLPAPACSHCTAGRPVATALWRGWRSAMMAAHLLGAGAPQTAE